MISLFSSYGGKEHEKTSNCEILTGDGFDWIASENGRVPERAVQVRMGRLDWQFYSCVMDMSLQDKRGEQQRIGYCMKVRQDLNGTSLFLANFWHFLFCQTFRFSIFLDFYLLNFLHFHFVKLSLFQTFTLSLVNTFSFPNFYFYFLSHFQTFTGRLWIEWDPSLCGSWEDWRSLLHWKGEHPKLSEIIAMTLMKRWTHTKIGASFPMVASHTS